MSQKAKVIDFFEVIEGIENGILYNCGYFLPDKLSRMYKTSQDESERKEIKRVFIDAINKTLYHWVLDEYVHPDSIDWLIEELEITLEVYLE